MRLVVAVGALQSRDAPAPRAGALAIDLDRAVAAVPHAEGDVAHRLIVAASGGPQLRLNLLARCDARRIVVAKQEARRGLSLRRAEGERNRQRRRGEDGRVGAGGSFPAVSTNEPR